MPLAIAPQPSTHPISPYHKSQKGTPRFKSNGSPPKDFLHPNLPLGNSIKITEIDGKPNPTAASTAAGRLSPALGIIQAIVRTTASAAALAKIFPIVLDNFFRDSHAKQAEIKIFGFETNNSEPEHSILRGSMVEVTGLENCKLEMTCILVTP